VPGSRTELEFSGPARHECLDRIHDLLAELWQLQPGVSETDQLMFSTAVLEVGNNILTHGTAALMSIAVTGNGHQLEAELTDDGAAVEIDLETATPLPENLAESGRGLALVRMAVDEVTHEYVEGRNRWHLMRRRQLGST
jgi:serine/threonine-protein kinase RsbW